jgi:prepilin-type N-terminal cleavage/methylation domain-containing protein
MNADERPNERLNRDRGFTLWELMVVVALVIVLFATAIENLLPLRGAAESAAFIATTGGLRSATGLEATRRVMKGGEAALRDMDGGNPMDWLAVRPGYDATIERGDLHTVAPGKWAYDAGSSTLFYRVRYPEYFNGSYTDPHGVRFRVTVSRVRGTVREVRLEQRDTAAWTMEGSELRRWLETSP